MATVSGTTSNDNLNGTVNNDLIRGYAGNDTINGGTGNDTIYGGAGNDTYIFNIGAGNDIILDGEGTNTIILGSDVQGNRIYKKDVDFSRNNDDLIISFINTPGDSLTIQNWFLTEQLRISQIQFPAQVWNPNLGFRSIDAYITSSGLDPLANENPDLNYRYEIIGEQNFINSKKGYNNDGQLIAEDNFMSYWNAELERSLYKINYYSHDTYQYDSNGKTINKIEYDVAPDGTILEVDSSTIRQFSYNGTTLNILTWDEWKEYNDSGNILEYEKYVVDSNTRISIHNQIGVAQGQLGQEIGHVDLSYQTVDSNNILITGMVYYNDYAGVLEQKFTQKYNSQGVLLEEHLYEYDGEDQNGVPVLDEESERTYDELGRLVQESSNENWSGNSHSSTYEYDLSGKLISGSEDWLVTNPDYTTDDGHSDNEYFYLNDVLISEIKTGDGWSNTYLYSDVFSKNNIYTGTAKDELISANDFFFKNSIISGNGGNDLIIGGGKDDTISGGSGNDSLYGGNGNNTYLFNIGDGHDKILDEQSFNTNIVKFGAGIKLSNLTFTKDDENLVIGFKNNSSDTLTIEKWYLMDIYKISEFKFTDENLSGDLRILLYEAGADNFNPADQETSGLKYVYTLYENANFIQSKKAFDDNNHLIEEYGYNSYWDNYSNKMVYAQTYNVDKYTFDSNGELSLTTWERHALGGQVLEADLYENRTINTPYGNLKINIPVEYYEKDILGITTKYEKYLIADINTINILDENDQQVGYIDVDYLRNPDNGNITVTSIYYFNDELDYKEEYTYNSSGKLIKEREYELFTINNSDQLMLKEDTNYLANGQITSSYRYDYDDSGSLIVKYSVINTFDAQMQKIVSSSESWNQGSDIGASNNVFVYINDVLVAKKRTDVANQWQDVIAYTEIYSENGIYNGTTDNDLIFASIDNDVVYGFGGNDILIGAQDNDTLIGGLGNDYLDGGQGNDLYIYNKTDGNDTVSDALISWDSGVSGNDTLKFAGMSSNEVEFIEDGNNLRIKILENNSIITVIDQYNNNDRVIENFIFTDKTINSDETGDNQVIITGSAGNDTLNGNNLDNYIFGDSGNDIINGLFGNDTLLAGLGNDSLIGGEGDDVLNGEVGNDTMVGGIGNDTYYVNSAFDKIIENYNEGTDLVYSNVSYTLSANLEKFILQGSSSINAVGNSSANTITGNSGNNFIDGGSANDTLYGNSGDDTLLGGDGVDLILGGTGNDYLLGGNSGDMLIGEVGNDFIMGENGDDEIFGDQGNDTLYGGAGNDIICGDSTDAGVVEYGNDVLIGGLGNDFLVGGGNNDTYIFNIGDGSDIISDYSGTNILILGSNTSGNQIYKSDLDFSRSNNSLLITFKNHPADSITIQNWFTSDANKISQIQLPAQSWNPNISADSVDDYIESNKFNPKANEDSNLTYRYEIFRECNFITNKQVFNEDGLVTSKENYNFYWNNELERDLYTSQSYWKDTYEYDANGNKIKEISYTIAPNGTILEKDVSAIHQFSSNGITINAMAWDEWIQYDESGNPIEHEKYVVDSNNRISIHNQIGVTEGQIGSEIGHMDLSYYTDGDGSLNVEARVYYDVDGGEYLERIQQKYNPSGILVEQKEYSYDIDTLDEYYANIYDSNGRIISRASNQYSAGIYHTSTFVYDERGRFVSGTESWTNKNPDQTISTGSSNNTYNYIGDVLISKIMTGDTWSNTYYYSDVYSENNIYSGTDKDELISVNDKYYYSYLVNGNGGNDLIIGGNGIDTIYGGDGRDFIVGNEGNDIIFGEDDNDEIYADAGNDSLYGGNGNDYIYGDGENETISGGGNDLIVGGLGNDTLIGGEGDDIFVYSSTDGNDVISEFLITAGNSLAGSNTIKFEGINSADVEFSRESNNLILTNTLTGNTITVLGQYLTSNTVIDNFVFIDKTINNDEIIIETVIINGTNGNDTLLGNSLNNIIYGYDGNDTIIGGIGSDTMIGGAGYDIYFVDDSGDVITENYNQGGDIVYSSVSYTLSDNVENLGLTGGAQIAGTGNSLVNLIIGNSSNNIINGGTAGNDTLFGWLGNDTYVINHTGITVVEMAANGTDIVQSQVTYELLDNVENLTLTGAGSIRGTGNTLANLIKGNNAHNVLDGGTAGADTLLGGLGNDTYLINRSNIKITENASAGTDLVQASISCTLADNIENLILTGSNEIEGVGNSLANKITGNSVANLLDGGSAGTDTLLGAKGNDTYIIKRTGITITENLNEGTDTIQSEISYTLDNNIENLTLTGSAAIIALGNTSNNIITGNSINNILDGGTAGDDTLCGAKGNDTYLINRTGIAATENLNEGVDIVQSTVTYTLLNNIENMTLLGSSAINGIGNTLANEITGNNANNILDGGTTGADLLVGKLGNDTYLINHTGTTVNENLLQGTDLIQSNIDYTLELNVENLTLTGSSAINGFGNISNNIIRGNSINNVLDGGTAGIDKLYGDKGDDTYNISHMGTTIIEYEDEGTDLIYSGITYTLGANQENLTLLGAARGTGNSMANLITGSSLANTISGGTTGNDTLIGANGNDIYNVNHTGMTIIEYTDEGTDSVISTISYTLEANLENLTLIGAVSGTGNSLTNIIIGSSSSNTLNGGEAGNDALFGDKGNDTYIINHTGVTITEKLEEGTDLVKSDISFTLGQNLENLILTGENVSNGVGNTLDNIIIGNSANNYINPGTEGVDKLYGGNGNDTYIINHADILITENSDEGTDLIRTSISFTMARNVENLMLIGDEAIFATGNASDNRIVGNSINNIFDAGIAGNDSLFGDNGDDTYLINHSGVIIYESAGQGIDVVESTISCTLARYVENLILTGRNYINGTGNGSDNIIIGNTTKNVLDAGTAGMDTLAGGVGNDTYLISHTGITITENAGEGTDVVESKISYTLGDNLEYLTLTGVGNINAVGNTLSNALTGNSYRNIIEGNVGNDVITGGKGQDSLYGGTNDDTYNFASGDNIDIISDTSGNIDKIKFLSDVDWSKIAVFRSYSYNAGQPDHYIFNSDNLIIDYSDAVQNDKITVLKQFAGESIERIYENFDEGGNPANHYLSNTTINTIVAHIAAYDCADGVANLRSVEDVKNNQELMAYIANQWLT